MIEITLTETAKWHMDREFQCPNCGSSHFGTSNPHIWEAARGNCHGQGCNFNWNRQLLDDSVFVLKEEL